MLLALNGSKSKEGPLFTHTNQKGANAFFLSTIVFLPSVLSQRRISQTKMSELIRLLQRKKERFFFFQLNYLQLILIMFRTCFLKHHANNIHAKITKLIKKSSFFLIYKCSGKTINAALISASYLGFINLMHN